MPDNQLIHAVAGGGKTRRIIDACAAADAGARVLALTYTTANQDEIRIRLSGHGRDMSHVTVMGWFQFLISCWTRPYVPFRFDGRRVLGFNFVGEPSRFATEDARYFDANGSIYKRSLSKLAHEVNRASDAAPIEWLRRSFDLIVIDEVQDLNGWDLEILRLLLDADIDILMVGDTRQAILATNPQDQKNKQYLYSGVIDWFRAQADAERITIVEDNATWRCHPAIAEFADAIFDPAAGYPATVSLNERETDHDGVFLVDPDHLAAYCAAYSPIALRFSASSGKRFDLDYSNFGEVKGLEFDRVLIAPTSGFEDLVLQGAPLAGITASKFYVGVTRARQSVGIICGKTGESSPPVWRPST
ncbi:MAG: DNA-dependent helicase [Thermoleophilia bacterium]|nr:DNA-dependent helicase [Thermoleophilia bacterium]